MFHFGAKRLSLNIFSFLSIPTRIGYQIDEICINNVRYDLLSNCMRIKWLNIAIYSLITYKDKQKKWTLEMLAVSFW